MRTRTLPTLPGIESAAGWSHPYASGPFSPYWYADGGDGKGDNDGDQDDSDGDGDQGGDGDGSDTDDDGVDWKAEAEKWKTQARKHEGRAKDNASAAKELAKLKRDGMPEQERATAEAVAKALAEERTKNGAKLARQAFLAAAKGVIPNAGDVADDVNLHRYVNDDGEIDEDGLAELVKRLAPKKSGTDENDEDDDREGGRDTRRRRGGGFDQGARRGGRKGGSSKSGGVDAGRDLYRELLGQGTDKS
jgi:hypothetical protein